MIILNVFLSIKADQESNFNEFAKELVQKSRAESGNNLYNLYKQTDADCQYIVVEHWKDEAAIESHNKTEHFQKFVAEIDQYIAEPLNLQQYSI